MLVWACIAIEINADIASISMLKAKLIKMITNQEIMHTKVINLTSTCLLYNQFIIGTISLHIYCSSNIISDGSGEHSKVDNTVVRHM